MPASVILLYHQLGRPASDPFAQYVDPEYFAGHVEVISKHRPLTLAGLSGEVRDGSVPANGIAVTFDDGYLSGLRIAKPVLERSEVPATVFVATGLTGGERDFWWYDLAEAFAPERALPVELRLDTGEAKRTWQSDTIERHSLLIEVWAWLRLQSPSATQAGLAAARDLAGLPTAGRPSEEARCMTVDELNELVSGGLIEVGAHTRTHPVLCARSPREQREEIAGSREDLEEWLGIPVTAFAYPFGRRPNEYREAAVRAVRASGLQRAVSVASLPVTAGSSIYELPRHVVPNIPADQFERWLEQCLDPPAPPRPPLLQSRVLRPLRERVAAPGRL
jgi:peptidoglycan/xylan/chitin deacetylase (PgdA/CDA1 family)